ncbi:CPBP family intramembrane glutamic endopeptidase [Halomonas rhizosphaerae]|uniref:CPBP family intramembrane metalloprotease n=1 Tax=Halomonas rhizosphaerae TaxID=3043296 RepID=A0ABT6UZQ8_9GAMM|nr:CPBP family intramembrane glutamic endopeptidase [Halomonas rhizosphaerae]MDI5891462.1 CPBP family intramembrane metalloprotease [Halomonas rhizosphaerae]
MLAFGMLYSLSLIVFGLCADARRRLGGAVAILLLAGLVGYATWLFVVLALGYVALSGWMQIRRVPPWLAWARIAAWVVASAGLVLHGWPGYEGLVVVEQRVLKEGSLPVSLYVSHDKVLVAWSLLGWLPLFGHSMPPVGGVPARAVPWVGAGGIVALMGLAVALGLVAWQPGLPEVFWVFAVANLLNTCVAEELLFRGMLQRWLMRRTGALVAVAVSSGLFGVAHLTGGGAFVLVATAAGLLYGLVYLWTGRLVWAVLVHWGLNLSHLLLFSYPMLAGA